ncbi:hypothetical protein BH23BAC4_BH23BAC4_13080 [soil metagenome]
MRESKTRPGSDKRRGGFSAALLSITSEVAELEKQPLVLRKFGLAVGGVFVLIAGVVFWIQDWIYGPVSVGFASSGALLILLGWLRPEALRNLYRVWMGVALVLGVVMTRVMLTLVYFLAVTPTGILRRTFGKSPVLTRPDPELSSYWIHRDSNERDPREALERLF